MKFITVLLLTLAFLSLKMKAQIICTDVNPDIVSTGNSTLDIDVNNDLTIDFRLTGALASSPGNTLGFVIVQAGQVGTNNYILSNGSGAALALPLNAVISSTSSTWFQMNSTNAQMMT